MKSHFLHEAIFLHKNLEIAGAFAASFEKGPTCSIFTDFPSCFSKKPTLFANNNPFISPMALTACSNFSFCYNIRNPL